MDGFERASVPVMPILIQPGCHTHSVCLGQAGVQQERESGAERQATPVHGPRLGI